MDKITTKDTTDLIHGFKMPEGSVFSVEKELKKHYKGIWASMYGTYMIKVKKSDCMDYAESPMPKFENTNTHLNDKVIEMLIKKIKSV